MDLRFQLRAVCHGMPPGSSVTLAVDWLRGLLDADERVERREERLLTLEDVAQEVGRAVSTVRTWCNSGSLEGAFRLNGRDWRIPERALCRYLERQANPPDPVPLGGPGPVDLGSWRALRKPGKGQGRGAA